MIDTMLYVHSESDINILVFTFFPQEKITNIPHAQSKLLTQRCLGVRQIENDHRHLVATAPNREMKLFCDTEMRADLKVLISPTPFL